MKNIKEMLDLFEMLCDKLEQSSHYSDEPLPVEICTGLPCFATPEEVSELIKAGYQGVLRKARIKVIVGNNTEGVIATEDIPMVQIASDHSGCVMCKEGECLLWKSGLTPLMGKLHLIQWKKMTPKMIKLLIHLTVLQWTAADNASTVDFCFNKMEMKTSNNHTN